MPQRRQKSHSLPGGARQRFDYEPGLSKGARALQRGAKKKKKPDTHGFTMVTFHVHADLGHGEHVCVVGNTAALGSDKMDRAVELSTAPSTYVFCVRACWCAVFSVLDNRVVDGVVCRFAGSEQSHPL